MSLAAGIVVLVGRIVFVLFFGPVAGTGHLKGPEAMENYARAAGFPVPFLARWPAGAWLWASSLSIALGIWPDLGALMVAVFVVIAGLYFHRFWKLEDPMQRLMQKQLFYRNVIALGASLMIFGFFAAAGEGLRFTITRPVFSF